jgi:hypothetical protein
MTVGPAAAAPGLAAGQTGTATHSELVSDDLARH